MSQSLVFGYIRNIEDIILKEVIPLPIYQLCFQYYENATMLYFLSASSSDSPQIYVVDIDNHPTNTWKCNIIKGIIGEDLKVAGLCHGNNIELPLDIKNKLNISNNICNMIFICINYARYIFL